MESVSTSGSWFDKIKKEISQTNGDIEMLAQDITARKTENNRQLIQLLKGIDFVSSGLSSEILNKKTNPNQWCGDLQYAVEILISHLEHDTPRGDDIDISEIDRSLYLIARMFEGAVIHGEVETAFAAKAGLMNGFFNIRNNVFSLDDNVRDNYMQACKKYLDSYYLYIAVKNIIDKSNENLHRKQANLSKEFRKLEENKDKMAYMITVSPELVDQLSVIQRQSYLQSHFMWTSEMVDLYRMLVEFRITQSGLLFKGYLLEAEEKRIYFYQEIAAKLEDIVRTVPVAEDPDILLKLQKMMEGTISKAEKIDNDFDVLGNMMSEFDKKLQSIGRSRQQSKMVASTWSDIEKKTGGQS